MSQVINYLFLSVVWIFLRQSDLECDTLPPAATEQSQKVATPNAADSQAATQAVATFLTWYKNHIDQANQIQLINQPAGKPYSVNLKNGERYLTYLGSSQLLTDTYLNEWRTYFVQRNEGFRATRQLKGIPTGFEYDLVLLSQQANEQLSALKSLKVNKVTIVKDRATVQFSLLIDYEFRLIRRNKRWIINEILNLSDE